MNERLSTQDLIDLLAEKHGMIKRDADGFVKEFFLLIEQALEADRSVKIKGLGTFKLIDVDSRESVNVNTGERIQIEGHAKVSFTPDPALRDVINKPFSHFETVILNENTILEDTPIDELEEEADDVTEEVDVAAAGAAVVETLGVEPLGEPIVEPVTESVVESVVAAVEQVTQDPVVATPLEPVLAIDPECKPTAEDIIAAELQQSNAKFKQILPEKYKPQPIVNQSVQPIQPAQKSPILYLATIIILVLLLCGSALLFIYYPDLFSPTNKKELVQTPDPQPVVQQEMLLDTVVAVRDTVAEVMNKKKEVAQEAAENLPNPTKVPAKIATPVKPDSVTYRITGTKATHIIKEGETLTRISLQFYGTKDLWPYIVQHNRNIITNPDNVPYGTTLKIPELVKR